MMHLKIRRCYGNGGPGRTRTFDVSNVADLQSAALAAGLPTHIFAFCPRKCTVQLQSLQEKMQHTEYNFAIWAISLKYKNCCQDGDLHGTRTRNLHLEGVAT